MDTLTTIEQLKDLEPDWDSYGAPPIAKESLEMATGYLRAVARALGDSYAHPIVGPTPQAGVALMWRARSGEVDLLCSPAGAQYVWLSPDHKVLRTEALTDPAHFAYQVLKQLEM